MFLHAMNFQNRAVNRHKSSTTITGGIKQLTHSKSDGGDNDLHAVMSPIGLHLFSLLLCHGCMVVTALQSLSVLLNFASKVT